MSAPFWLKCNLCLCAYTKSDEFYLLSCRHVLCRNCIAKTVHKDKICPLEKNRNIRDILLSRLPEHQRSIFQFSLSETINAAKVNLRFQKKQKTTILKQYQNKAGYYKKVVEAISKMKGKLTETNDEVNKRVDQRCKMQVQLHNRHKQQMGKKTSMQYRANQSLGSTSTLTSASSRSSFITPRSNITVGSIPSRSHHRPSSDLDFFTPTNAPNSGQRDPIFGQSITQRSAQVRRPANFMLSLDPKRPKSAPSTPSSQLSHEAIII